MIPKLWIYAGIALTVALVIGLVYLEGRNTGETRAVNKQEAVNEKARKRKASVIPADSRVTIERLRQGSY
jgi:uncharacterized membrane-anchored protein YhcB (DUF1043 family)